MRAIKEQKNRALAGQSRRVIGAERGITECFGGLALTPGIRFAPLLSLGFASAVPPQSHAIQEPVPNYKGVEQHRAEMSEKS